MLVSCEERNVAASRLLWAASYQPMREFSTSSLKASIRSFQMAYRGNASTWPGQLVGLPLGTSDADAWFKRFTNVSSKPDGGHDERTAILALEPPCRLDTIRRPLMRSRHDQPPCFRQDHTVTKLLITNTDTLAGGNLAVSLRERMNIVGLYQRRPVQYDGCKSLLCDLDDPTAITEIVREESPDWIIHCGPLAASSWELRDCASGVRRNEVAMAGAIMRAAAPVRAAVTVITTDAVLTGPRIFHSEGTPARATGAVAITGRRTERAMLDGGALVVRTHLYGWNTAGEASGWSARAFDAIRHGDIWPETVAPYATPILASDLAWLLYRAYALNLRGLWHIAGAERTNARRFVTTLQKLLGVQPRTAHAVGDSSTPSIAATETSLDTRRARQALGRSMPMLGDGLLRFLEQADNGHRDALQQASTTHQLPMAA
jgi:dTDP-4-dehydrorhamnose reductase